MFSRSKILVLAASLVGVATFGITATSASATTRPHLVPANTLIHATLKSGTTFKATGDIDDIAVTVTCKSVTASGKTPRNGLTATLSAPPAFTKCSDSLGGTDTVHTAGTWSITVNSTGSAATLNVPQNAATFSSSIVSGCTITVDPNGATKVHGSYNDMNTYKETKQNLPVSASGSSGCTASPNTSTSSTIVISPNVSVAG